MHAKHRAPRRISARPKSTGSFQGFPAALHVAHCVIEADDGHNAGLNGSQGNKEGDLLLVIQTQRRYRMIRKARQNQVQAQDIKSIWQLHQPVGNAQAKK